MASNGFDDRHQPRRGRLTPREQTIVSSPSPATLAVVTLYARPHQQIDGGDGWFLRYQCRADQRRYAHIHFPFV